MAIWMKLLRNYVSKIKHKKWSIYKMLMNDKNQITYHEALQRASSFLQERNESSFVAEWLLRERLNWTKTDLVKHHRVLMPALEYQQYGKDLEQYLKGK